MSNCTEDEKVVPTGKSVLLFSGGMDSLIFNTLLKPDVLLYVPCRALYDHQEGKCLETLKFKYQDVREKLVSLENVFNFGFLERKDYIIPGRNAHLILMAANYGETIYLGSVQGDRSKDKDEKFYSLMTALLDHINSEQHWTHERKFRILDPYKNYTKTELVAMYLQRGGSVEALLDSYSCYSGNARPCGHCKPCVRKWVALVNNGILTKKCWALYFHTNPMLAEWVAPLLPAMERGEYRGKEDADFLKVYK